MTKRQLLALSGALVLGACEARARLQFQAAPELVVVPDRATLAPLQSQQFSASAPGSIALAVTWSIQEGTTGGTVDASGNYVAPGAVGVYHVVATSQADAKTAAATVTVTNNPATDYTLPDDRRTTWRPGVTYNGGIPTNRTQCGSTFTPSSTQAQIQNALNTCPDNTYVLLGPGTYSLGSGGLSITRSRITLRGSGAGSTILQMANGQVGSPVTVGTWDGMPHGWMDWRPLTSDAVKATNTVTVGNFAGLKVGELVHIDEQYDSALAYYNNRAPQGDCGPLQQNDYLGWGECRCVRDASCTPPGCTTNSATAAAQAQSRPVGQALEIGSCGTSTPGATCTSGTLTFTSPFHWTLRVSKNARLARLVSNGTVKQPVREVGVENLTARYGYGGDGWANIYFSGTMYSWAKNVETAEQIQGGSIVISGGFRNEIRDSYLHSARDPNPGGAGYGIEIETYASDNLVENSIVWSFNKVLAMRSSGGGNVIGYNYFEDGYGQGYPTIVEVGINASHMAGSHMELFEGNQGFNFDSDSYWGTQFNMVVYRNHLTSLRRNMPGNLASLSDVDNRRAVGLTSFQRNYSFVGNVLGYPDGYLRGSAVGHDYPAWSPLPAGSTFTYEWTGNWGQQPFMWQIGYDGSGYDCTNGWKSTPDAQATSTTLRDGNYDFVSNKVHWHGIGGSGVNNGLTPPANSNLPASLYLTGKPAFFGSNPWPWVDPQSTGRVYTLPARARFDAGTPNG